MEKATPGNRIDSNLEMMPIWKCCRLFIRSSSTYAKIQGQLGRIPPKYNKKRTSRLSRAASVRAIKVLWRAVVAGNVTWPMPCMPRLTPLADGALRCSGSRTGRGR